MKKINSIWFGGKIIGVGIVFFIFIPLILFGIEKVLVIGNVLIPLIKISIGIGLFILAVFTGILIIELNQDKKLNSQYYNKRYSKIKLSDANYECQNCGNLKLKKDDKDCNLCGIKFK
jgi:hypothetical protein